MSITGAKKRGRPPRDTEAVNVRLDRSMLEVIDNWRRTHPAGQLTRPEAIRQLIVIGLGVPDSEE